MHTAHTILTDSLTHSLVTVLQGIFWIAPNTKKKKCHADAWNTIWPAIEMVYTIFILLYISFRRIGTYSLHDMWKVPPHKLRYQVSWYCRKSNIILFRYLHGRYLIYCVYRVYASVYRVHASTEPHVYPYNIMWCTSFPVTGYTMYLHVVHWPYNNNNKVTYTKYEKRIYKNVNVCYIETR